MDPARDLLNGSPVRRTALVVVRHDRRFNSRWRGTVVDLKETFLVSH